MASRAAGAATTSRTGATPKVSREEIAAIVDRFLANRPPDQAAPAPLSQPVQSEPAPRAMNEISSQPASQASANGRKAAEFVSEDDVRRAIQKSEKIYVDARTIITPSARDIGEPAEVFAKT